MGSRILTFAKRYRPSLLVLASQMVAATLNTAAKVSETGSEAVHPFMILHIRMLITGLGSTLYLWINRPSRPEALFGNPDVQGLIFLRALGGVCSATGFFFSMIYMSLSEATALNSLGPLGSLMLTRYLSFATVQRIDYVGAVGAVVGVVLVVQPETLSGTEKGHGHVKGLACGVFGVCGGVVALTSIRRIGVRAHPLTSVNMFAWSLVFVSGIALTIIPEIAWPSNPFVWACLIYIGISGFAMEYLLTVGISNDSSSAATLMTHTQIVWALAVDCTFFHVRPNAWALFGAAAIVSSLCLVTILEKGSTFDDGIYTALKGEEEEGSVMMRLDELEVE